MKKIPLTRGKFALVDDEDYEWLRQFKWTINRRGVHTKTEYASVTFSGKLMYMHRFILRATPGVEVDHRDGNGLNNQKSNLRKCKHFENCRNRSAPFHSASGFKGVTWHTMGKKWMACLKVNGKQKYLGLFSDRKKAALSYDAAALKEYGEFARTNF